MIYNLCIFADSTYPAAMPHSVVFNLGPHCLHKYPLTNIVDPSGSKKYLTEIFLKKCTHARGSYMGCLLINLLNEPLES